MTVKTYSNLLHCNLHHKITIGAYMIEKSQNLEAEKRMEMEKGWMVYHILQSINERRTFSFYCDRKRKTSNKSRRENQTKQYYCMMRERGLHGCQLISLYADWLMLILSWSRRGFYLHIITHSNILWCFNVKMTRNIRKRKRFRNICVYVYYVCICEFSDILVEATNQHCRVF